MSCIIDMDVPENCQKCPLRKVTETQDDYPFSCGGSKRNDTTLYHIYKDPEGKPDWCPFRPTEIPKEVADVAVEIAIEFKKAQECAWRSPLPYAVYEVWKKLVT